MAELLNDSIRGLRLPTPVASSQPAAARPAGPPTWNDLYTEYTNQDWFKKQQAHYDGQIDRKWNSDEGTIAAKQAIDDLYTTRLGEYNAANGTNFKPDEKMLGADAQPNDWNRKENPRGFIEETTGIKSDDLIKVIAIGAAAYFALPLLTAAGGGTVGAAAAASGAGTASGLAGYMGMNVGYAATALNVGAINTGVALASGSNIGDALKAGAAAAAMSPLGAMAGAGVGGQLAGAVLEGAVNGGGAAALLGKDVVRGAVTGGVVGGATYGLGQLTADPSQIDYTNYDNGTAVGPAQPMPDGFDFSPGTPSAGAADLGTVNVSGSGGLNMSGAVNPASLGQVQVTGQRDPQAQQNSADEPGGLNPVTVTGKRDPITGNAVTEDDLKLLPMPGMPTDGTPAGEVGKTEDKKVEDKDKEKGYFDKYGKWIKPALGLIGAGGAAGAVGGGGTGGGQPAMGGTYTPDGIADDLWSNWKAGRQGLYDEADRVGADARRYQGFAEDSARGFGSDIDWLSGERDKYAGQADAAAAQMYGDAAKGRAEFDQYFAPTFAKYQTQVDKYNDPAYIGRLRGESMESAAALQQAGDAQALRGASRYGYGSGAMMDTLATRASDNARAKLGAALGTEQSLRGMYDQGLQNLNKMGQYAGDFGLRNADNMVNATRFGLDGKQKAADLGQRATTAIGTARTNQTSAYKSALDFSQTPLGLKTKLMGFESDIGKNTASIYTDSYRARTNQFGAETQRNQGDAKQSADNWKNVGGAIQWGLSKDGAAAWDTVKKWFPG